MKRLHMILALSAVTLVSSLGLAGYKENYAVGIYDINGGSSGSAWGSAGYVHNSADNVQMMGGSVGTYSDGVSVSCVARKANGLTRVCVSSDERLAQAAMNIKGDSYISFAWTSVENGEECTSISVDNGSQTQ